MDVLQLYITEQPVFPKVSMYNSGENVEDPSALWMIVSPNKTPFSVSNIPPPLFRHLAIPHVVKRRFEFTRQRLGLL